jgi:hypothetical protein
MTRVSSKPMKPGIKPEKDICLGNEYCHERFARLFLKISLCHSNISEKSSHQTNNHLDSVQKS